MLRRTCHVLSAPSKARQKIPGRLCLLCRGRSWSSSLGRRRCASAHWICTRVQCWRPASTPPPAPSPSGALSWTPCPRYSMHATSSVCAHPTRKCSPQAASSIVPCTCHMSRSCSFSNSPAHRCTSSNMMLICRKPVTCLVLSGVPLLI